MQREHVRNPTDPPDCDGLEPTATASVCRWALLLAVLFAFASATLLTRLLLVRSLAQPDTLMALRYTISALAMGLLGCVLDQGKTHLSWKTTYLWGGLLIAAQAILLGIASKMAAASIVGLCFFGGASWAASLMGSYFKRQWRFVHLVGVGVGGVGLFTVIPPHGDVNLGSLLALGGGVAWGGYLLWSQNAMPNGTVAIIVATSRAMAIGAGGVWLVALLLEPHGLRMMQVQAWWAVLYIGLLPQSLGVAALGWLATRLNHVELGVSQLGAPILVAIGGVAILGESATWRLWVGLSFVLLGMVLASQRKRFWHGDDHKPRRPNEAIGGE